MPALTKLLAQDQPDLIHAELSSSDTACALGITVQASAPVLALCRRLVETGCDPRTPLEAWRGNVLCLRIRSIGEGASLEINADGTGFRRRRAPDAAQAMRNSNRAAVRGARPSRERAMTRNPTPAEPVESDASPDSCANGAPTDSAQSRLGMVGIMKHTPIYRRRGPVADIQRRHVLSLMRGGQTLSLVHTSTGRRWHLSGGMRVADDIARQLVKEGDVVGDNDTLFRNTPSQTWRYAS
jgi:hypothetical protein